MTESMNDTKNRSYRVVQPWLSFEPGTIVTNAQVLDVLQKDRRNQNQPRVAAVSLLVGIALVILMIALRVYGHQHDTPEISLISMMCLVASFVAFLIFGFCKPTPLRVTDQWVETMLALAIHNKMVEPLARHEETSSPSDVGEEEPRPLSMTVRLLRFKWTWSCFMVGCFASFVITSIIGVPPIPAYITQPLNWTVAAMFGVGYLTGFYELQFFAVNLLGVSLGVALAAS